MIDNVIAFPKHTFSDALKRRDAAVRPLIEAYLRIQQSVVFTPDTDDDTEKAIHEFEHCADEFVSAQQAFAAAVSPERRLGTKSGETS